MAKSSGLNVRLYIQGYDVSGDANSLSTVGYTNTLYDIATLDSTAQKRLMGPVDGTLGVNGWFDNRSGGIHPIFTSNSGKLPTADQNVLVPMGASIGAPSCAFVAKEADYNVESGSGAAVSVSSTFPISAGIAPLWGVMLTAHDDTASSAANGTSVDNSASSASGGVGMIQSFSLASGTAVCKVQHSADNATFTDLATFTNVTGVTSEYKEVTGTVNRYIRYSISGTFSNLNFAMAFSRG